MELMTSALPRDSAENGRNDLRPYKKGANCLKGKWEEFEVTFAREDNGEEAAVGRDAEFSDGNTVEDGARRGLQDGYVFSR